MTGARDPEAGLTLIEMLIVLVILGIASSAAVLGLNSLGRDRSAEVEAARLAAMLEMAVDEGLVGHARLALVWTNSGYDVQRWGPDGWTASTTARLSPHGLPAGLTLRRADGRSDPVDIAEDGLGPSVALEITGTGSAWVVAFDGLSVTVHPEAAR